MFGLAVLDYIKNEHYNNVVEKYHGGYQITNQPVKSLTKPDLLDYRAAIFLILDGYELSSVKDFCQIAREFWPDEAILLDRLRINCALYDDYEMIKTNFENECDNLIPGESTIFKSIFSSILGDFLEAVPHLHQDKSLTEDDLYFNAHNTHICEHCGDEIEPGEPAFFRTIPCPAIRHRKCSRNIRSSSEYAFIDYFVKEIAYHEQVFRFKECCNYKLLESPGISLKQHRKFGYSIEHDGSVSKIPFLGEFVMDFISGVEDYELIKKFRPYHVYIEFMLRAIGIEDFVINNLGGFKYLLRESIGRQKYPSVAKCIDNISLSELMFDRHIHKLVASEIINTVYIAIFKKIFQVMGILTDGNSIKWNGMMQSYSINDDNSDADISIVIDKDDIYCVDFEKSLPFTEFFTDLPDEACELLNYCKQFGVDI